MEMRNTRLLPAPRGVVWQALNDTAVLQQCIPGCERLEATGDGRYAVSVTAVIGPVKAKYDGHLVLRDLDPPQSYRIEFEAQGATAGFGKGAADVVLIERDATTELQYAAQVQVGGKLAQIGSRLVDAAARKISGEFFDRFERAVQDLEAGRAAAVPAAVVEPSVAASASTWRRPIVILAIALFCLLVWWLTRG